MVQWEDAVVLITGASRGIGRAVAHAVARRGARLGLIARDRAELEAVLAACGGRGVVAAADVSDRGQAEAAVGRVLETLGRVDVLVNNAGVGAYGPFAEVDPEVIDRVVGVDLLGTLYVTRAVLPAMLARGRGHIVTVGSISGRMGTAAEATYAAAKFGQVGFTESLAVELHESGIGVSLVEPGPVATDFFRARGAPYVRPFPRPIPPERVAEAVIAAVECRRLEVFVPWWLRLTWVTRVLAPGLFLRGAVRDARRAARR